MGSIEPEYKKHSAGMGINLCQMWHTSSEFGKVIVLQYIHLHVYIKVGNIADWPKLFLYGHVNCLISNIMKTIQFDIVVVKPCIPKLQH